MSALDPEQRELVRDLLSGAIPVNPQGGGSYVTREEFDSKISHLETKIEREGLRMKAWVLAGVISIIVALGGSWMSLMTKLDRIAEATPVAAKKLEERAVWIQRVEHRDRIQDEELQRLSPTYEPLPYQEVPR